MHYVIRVSVLFLALCPLSSQAQLLHPVKTKGVEPPSRFSFQKGTIVTELTPLANIWLVDERLHELWKREPLVALDRMRSDIRAVRDRQAALGLAELEGTAAFRLRKKDAQEAMELFLRSAVRAQVAMNDPHLKPIFELGDRRAEKGLLLQNEALAEALRLLRELPSRQAMNGEMVLVDSRDLRIDFHCGHGFAVENLSRLELCRDYHVQGLSPRMRSGIGVTAFTLEEKNGTEEMWFPPRRAVPWTAWIEPIKYEGEQIHLQLHIINPLSSVVIHPQATTIVKKSLPTNLAEDITTPLAYLIDTSPLKKLKRMGFLRPDEVPEATGLFTLTPYEGGKIPVVLVHGLYSSPVAFAEMYNTLMADPQIRRRCHFFFFQYPTGNPFLYSTLGLRTMLRQLHETYSYSGANPAFDQMMIVGHSMGGILTKMQIQDSGNQIWERISDRPIDQVEGDPKEREMLRNLVFFEHQPFVRRVVFMATPHQGSELAASMVARAGARMIRLPRDVTAVHDSLVKDLDPLRVGRERHVRAPTSIDDLAPHSPVLQVLSELERNESVAVHSIIGNILPVPPERGTDGVVPYKSAHLDDVESELVIRSSHSCEHHPDAIGEVERVLKEHLVRVDKERGVHSLAQ